MLTSSKSLDCCVCGENAQSTFFKKVDGFHLLKCTHCKLVRLSHVAIQAESFLNDAAEETEGKLEYWGYPEYFKKHAEVFNYFFNERYHKILSHKIVDGEWLDVGSGYGLWQSFLLSKNQPSIGIEIEKKAYLYTKSISLENEHISIQNYMTEKKFAVITMCDVLEHVEDPASVLQKCYDLLLPNGLLYLQVPNVIGLKYPYGDTLGLPHHLWQFNPHTLRRLTQKFSFKTVGLWTGVQGVIRHYERGQPSLLRRALWKMARISGRGNRLQLLVRK